ncbi:MAG: response regulator, partial [Planctomycetes bacterium]|nr:response regulator [Planctomycetota bacterium]
MAYVGGEIDVSTYTRTRDHLIERLRTKEQEFRTQQAANLRGLATAFKEAVTLFEDPQNYKRPDTLPEKERLASYLDARILHVDDEIDKGWDVVMPLLFGDRYQWETDPEKVVERIAALENRGEPFLVLLDLGLKSGDSLVPKAWRGVDLLHSIRTSFPAVPVHVFSARNDMQTYQRVMEAGANGFIRKPCQVLSSDDTATLHRVFREQLLAGRYDIFRYFLYRAFDVIQQGLKTGTGEPPFKDGRDRKWQKRRQNLLLFLEELENADLERTVRDRDYAAMAIRNLILALYRPFERRVGEGRPDHYKASLLSAYRNECAHAGGEWTQGKLHSFDLRDLMLTASLLLDPETLNMRVPEDARVLAEQAYRALFREPSDSELRKWLRDVCYEDWGDRPMNRRLAKSLPQNHRASQDAWSRRIFWLTADKVLRPTVAKQQAGVLSVPVMDPVVQMLPVPVEKAAPRKEPFAPTAPPPGRWRKGIAYFFAGDEGDRVIN